MRNMLKRTIYAILILLVLTTPQSSLAANISNNGVDKINGVASNYNIVRTKYDKNSKTIGIFYPQISGIKDKTKQIKINKLIKDTALVAVQDSNTIFDWYDLDYTIMWSSDKILSIKFSGNSYVETAPHPNNECFMININMNNGNKFVLPELISINNDFLKLFINKSEFLNDPVELPADTLMELKEDKFSINNLKYDFDKNAQFYFTSKGIVFYISTYHAIGDYTLFSLKFSDLTKYIKSNTLWNSIKSDFVATDYQIVREQCFLTNLVPYGDVWFVSGFNSTQNGIKKDLRFYLIDKNSKVKYAFPALFSNSLGYYGITAVAFRDVNNDNRKDIIIVANVKSNKETEVDEVGVFLNKSNGFVIDKKLNTYLNSKLADIKTISDVLKLTKNYYKG